MPAFCAVRGCGARHRKGDNISFHAFPHRNPALMSRWLRALGQDDLKPKNHHRVCSQHFKASCFYAGLDRPCLRPDAVPTEFAGCRKAWPTTGIKHTASDASSHKSPAHGMATRLATKVQERKAAQDKAEQMATSRITKDASTNTTLSLSKDLPSEARMANSESQPLPKKLLFQLRHEAGSQAKESRHVSTSKQLHIDTERPKADNIISKVAQSKSQDSDGDSVCCTSPESESGNGGVVNRDLESAGPDPVLTATGALFLHTYCGERSEPDHMIQLRQSLQAAKRRLTLVERRLKRNTEAFAQLLSANKELKFELSQARRLEQQQFSISERLPQDLLRDWHENAGRVPHARRYSPLTLRFAAELHTCSRTAYEHVARWLPMPTLHLVRRHSATHLSSSRDSGWDSATVATSDRRTDAAASAKFSSVPASRFASSVSRNRAPTDAKKATESSSSSSATFVAPAVNTDMATTIQGGSDAPTMFVINSAAMPEMAIPASRTESTLAAAVKMTPAIMAGTTFPILMRTPATVMEMTPVTSMEPKPAATIQLGPALKFEMTPSSTTEVTFEELEPEPRMEATPATTIETVGATTIMITPTTSTQASLSLASIQTSATTVPV